MQIDLVLPTVSLLFLNAVVWAYPKVEPAIRQFMEEGEFTVKDALGLAAIMAIAIAVLALSPSTLLLAVSMIGIGLVLNLTSLIVTGNRWISLLLPCFFYVCFFFFWNLGLLNVFAIILAFGASLILANAFSWKASLAFVAVLTLIDVIHVFGTKMMVEVGYKGIQLRLPLMLLLPTFPAKGYLGFGLGDLFVAALLTVKNWEKFGGRAGLITSAYIALFIGLIVPMVEKVGALPATLFISAGWIASYLHIRVRRWS
ncbi:MAG: hypothetical protein DRN90_06185 [Thermoproteota archaeon]|nr:MAG: hypothetical protein DRN90_06185 [Candidatus Korarchaeota archaeon]